jgi:steroid delta-isomerase-like uncharacterized protein
MSIEENKALARRWMEEVITETNFAAMEELLAEDVVIWQGATVSMCGRAAVRQANEQVREAMQQRRYTIEDLVAEGDKVACRYTFAFTHAADFPGIPATGKAVSEHGIMLVRVTEGRIAEWWDQADRLGLLQQLGVLPGAVLAAAPDASAPVADQGTSQGAATTAASTEANKAVVRRFVDEIWNRANLAAAEELMAEDALAGGQAHGPQAMREAVTRNAVTLPDAHFTIDDIVAEGDRVVIRWTRRGTHLGVWDHAIFGRVPPTGNVITTTGINLFRLADGKIAERWQFRDDLGTVQQLGVLPTPQQGPT